VNIFKDKKVLITGHTGFKGSWLATWLNMKGAKVHGIALNPHSQPSNFDISCISEITESSHINDIKDLDVIKNIVNEIQPDFIFHLAAQALVKESYINPVNTMATNAIGTINILEALKGLSKCICILVTSDKCYKNNEWVWGYREQDELGGEDPYSASKAMAEIAINSYFKSFFEGNPDLLIGSARAGNVIGGGDWSNDRIIPDAMKQWSADEVLQIRMPQATRPWQHVLEPLSGYIRMAEALHKKEIKSGSSYNFGPPKESNRTVGELVERLSALVTNKECIVDLDQSSKIKESNLLHLCTDKAHDELHWKPKLNFSETLDFTSKWYMEFYSGNKNMRQVSEKQIELFENKKH